MIKEGRSHKVEVDRQRKYTTPLFAIPFFDFEIVATRHKKLLFHVEIGATHEFVVLIELSQQYYDGAASRRKKKERVNNYFVVLYINDNLNFAD